MGIFDGEFGWDDVANIGTGGMYGVAKGGYDYLNGEGDAGDALNIATGGQAGQIGSVSDLGASTIGSGPDISGIFGSANSSTASNKMDAQTRLLMEMQRAALEYQKYRPEVRQARMNAMRQQSQAYQPANNALQTMYGESFSPGSMFDDPFGPSVDTPSGMPLPQTAGRFDPNLGPGPESFNGGPGPVPPPRDRVIEELPPGPRMPSRGAPPVMAPPQMGPRRPAGIFG